MNVGEKIKSLRRGKRLTQEQLAELLHISPQAVSKWETGASSPDIDMLPRLAAIFRVSLDELLDFAQWRIDGEVDALVRESVPLRAEPERAAAFYRSALERYPNNEVLLNCLLMVLPSGSRERREIGARLLEYAADDAVKYDVLRLLALDFCETGEQAMAESYLEQLPELYFLKTEIGAAVRSGPEQMRDIQKTEDVCAGIWRDMLLARARLAEDDESRARLLGLLHAMGALLREHPEYRALAERLTEAQP